MKLRIFLTLVIVLFVLFCEQFAERIIFPSLSMEAAVDQVEDGSYEFYRIQALEYVKIIFSVCLWGLSMLMILLIWKKPFIKRLKGVENEKETVTKSFAG